MKQILQAIKSLFRKIEISIDEKLKAIKKESDRKYKNLESLVNSTNQELENTNNALAQKASKENATLSGSLSLNTSAPGFGSVALGYGCIASGSHSTAIGLSAGAKGRGGIAAGYGCSADGQGATATCYYTQAKGEASFAGGYECNAYAIGSHASGYRTEAKGEYQFVHGKCNVPDEESKYAHIVGNGYKKPGYVDTKSNAYTLDWSGNGWFAGSVEATAIILTSPNGSRFRITVDDSGNMTATAET